VLLIVVVKNNRANLARRHRRFGFFQFKFITVFPSEEINAAFIEVASVSFDLPADISSQYPDQKRPVNGRLGKVRSKIRPSTGTKDPERILPNQPISHGQFCGRAKKNYRVFQKPTLCVFEKQCWDVGHESTVLPLRDKLGF